MKRHLTIALSALLVAVCSHSASAALFSDNFDSDTSGDYTVLEASAGDDSAAVTFAYDYSADGIPAAPGGVTTSGVKFEVNTGNNGAAAQEDAITIVPTGLLVAGDVHMKFHMWINAPGTFPGGGAGSTEFFTAGVAHDSATHNLADSGAPAAGEGSGAWFAVTGEGGTTNDYQGLVDISRPYVQNAFTLATEFPGIDVAAVNGGALTAAQGASQTGTTSGGSQGFAWREVVIRRVGDDVTWSIDGVQLATIDATGLGDGSVSLGMSDGFSSVANGLAFGLADNLVVTVPEPATFVLLGLGSLGLAFRRRK